MRTTRIQVSVLVTAVSLSGVLQAAAEPARAVEPSPAPACRSALRSIPGQGPSCRVAGGLWKVDLGGGRWVLTPGPDAPPPDQQPGARVRAAGSLSPRPPVCGTENVFRAILAYPSGVVPDETVESFRDRLHVANAFLHQAAVESGSPRGADFRFLCDAEGRIRVAVRELPTPSTADSFYSIVTDLQALGFARPKRKYVVWYDAAMSSYLGQATFRPDETAGPGNRNNRGGSYAIAYDGDALLHEMGHTLGAVQYNAPHSTGSGAHCWEQFDVLCYHDGGDRDRPDYVYTCSDLFRFDCSHDDYFDAVIGDGQGGGRNSYIATHWNIGACYDRWVRNHACPRRRRS